MPSALAETVAGAGRLSSQGVRNTRFDNMKNDIYGSTRNSRLNRILQLARSGQTVSASREISRFYEDFTISGLRSSEIRLLAKITETFRLKEVSRPNSGNRVDCRIGAEESGVSLVTCVRNRTKNLMQCLETWLAVKEIDQIVIVDWTSDIPIRKELADAGIDDAKIEVVEVLDEPRWILPPAFNLGFRHVRFDKVLKVDADIKIHPDFFSKNILGEADFIAGNWEAAAKGQEHINGFFYLKTSHLAAINGFNEYITTYGWDDDDIYRRLSGIGLQRKLVSLDSIHHLDHDNASRTGNSAASINAWDELESDPMFHIRRNRFISNCCPVWNEGRQLAPFELVRENGARYRQVRRLVNEAPHYVTSDIKSDSRYYAALELISWRSGTQAYHVPRARFECLLKKHCLEDFGHDLIIENCEPVTDYFAELNAPQTVRLKARLFIDAQHGLGNRLRAIASAAAIAKETDRELVIVWQPDAHCEGRFGDLYRYQGAVIEESFVSDASRDGCKVYNYMEVEPDAAKGRVLDMDWKGDIYARSAYVLNAPPSRWETENYFLNGLRPVEEVQALVGSVRKPNDVSVHVRMVGGAEYEHLEYEALDNWTKEGHEEIKYWREKSHFSHFIKRLDRLVAEGGAERIFLAADKQETYDVFLETFGSRVAYLPRELYDRSAEQLQYALADAMLLGTAPLLLGSGWSSFSELAMRLSPSPMKIEMSGKDF